MLYRISQTLRNVFRPKPSIALSIPGLSSFSSCRPTLIARKGPADEILTPQQSQTPQDIDDTRLKDERRKARGREYWRAWYDKKKQDPAWLERTRIYYRRWLQEQKKDEASWERHLDSSLALKQISLQRVREDSARLERYKAQRREYRKRAGYDFERLQAFRKWFGRHKADLDTFTWKRWRPAVLSESVDKVCAGCGTRNRRGPRRLWFVRKSNPELWDCLPCFGASDVSDIVPVEGAERFYNGQYLQPQSKGTEDTVDDADAKGVVVLKEKNSDLQVHGEEYLKVDRNKTADP